MIYKKREIFNITEITPDGWLKNQLEIQMNGLTGKLYDIWDSVGSYSGWLGGSGENWERAPYYLDGLLPISYYLQDVKGLDICNKFIEWTFKSQDKEGNFGPDDTKKDYWSRTVMLKVLLQYYEIYKDTRVLDFYKKYILFLKKSLIETPVTYWAKARVADLMYCLKWYYEINPLSDALDVANILMKQGTDWNDFLVNFPYTKPTAYYYNWDELKDFTWFKINDFMKYHETHIVNVTMGLKYPAMCYAFNGDNTLNEITKNGIDTLVKYHGVVSGAINGDEHLSGNSPSQGSELCSIVEYMFSLQTMLEIFGDAVYGDILEKLAFNALPATITEDFNAHQYLQQANQVLVTKAKRNWFNNNEESNLFGLEPNFGCCTANMHQGWPKLLKSLWMKETDEKHIKLYNTVFAPCNLKTEINGKVLEISVETNYPFRDQINYSFKQCLDQEITLNLRLPNWCKNPKLQLNNLDVPYEIKDGFVLLKQIFKAGDMLTYTLPMDTFYSHWYNNSLSIERGPLVYGLDIDEQFVPIKERAGIVDYEVYPKSEWNYMLVKDEDFKLVEKELDYVPFSKANPPTEIYTNGLICEEWAIEDNSAMPPMQSPVVQDGVSKKIKLIPFGCTKLRVSQFPWTKK